MPAFQPRPLGSAEENLSRDRKGAVALNPSRAREQAATSDAHPHKASVTAFNPPLDWLANLTEDDFRKFFRRSPLKRARYRGLLRNVAVAMGNSGLPKFRPVLEKLAQHPDPVVQEHARGALRQLSEPRP